MGAPIAAELVGNAAAQLSDAAAAASQALTKANYSVSIFDGIPASKRAAIQARTSTDSLSTYMNGLINELSAAGGGVINASAGRYCFDDPIVKKPGVFFVGDGMNATTFIRTADVSLMTISGPNTASGLAPLNNFFSSDIEFRSAAVWATTLLDLAGATYVGMKRCRILAHSCTVLSLLGVWDSRFTDVLFANGGLEGVRPLVRLAGGYGYGIGTKEVVFDRCIFEDYYGCPLQSDTGAMSGYDPRPHLITLSNTKFDSVHPVSTHIDLRSAFNVLFNTVYVSAATTAGADVVRIGGGGSWQGDLVVTCTPESTGTARSALSLEGAYNVDLRLMVTNQPAGMDAVHWDGANSDSINVSAVGNYPTVNGRYQLNRNLRASSLNLLGTTSDVTRLFLNKSGELQWSFGEPVNASGAQNDVKIRAYDASGNGGTFLTCRASTQDMTTAVRSLIPGGNVLFGSLYTDPNLIRIGTSALFKDSKGNTRVTTSLNASGAPTSDTAGYLLKTNVAGNTAGRPSSPEVGQEYFDITLGRTVTHTGSAWAVPFRSVAVPATSTTAGQPNDIAIGNGYAHFYTGDGTTHSWVRAAVASW